VSDQNSEHSADFVLLTRLADEFAQRYRRGERPSLAEYVERYPHLAADIREVFPALVEVEQVKEDHQEAAEQTAAPPAPALQQLGDFRILREVGQGGMGIVYEAEQVSLGRHVALKVLPRNLLLDARARRRFEREAKSAARLHHTNIVPVFGVGEQDGLPYFVMQFIQGLGLDVVLDELKKLQPGNARTGTHTAGELRVSRKELSAVHVARSLLTGEFLGPKDNNGEDATAATPDAAAREDQGADSPRPPALSDSFSLSSSSVALPGESRDGSKSRHRKQTYWHSVASIGVQVAQALEYAHKQGIRHRDIKPSNLLLDTQGTVWVTDFGLAKADDQQNLTHTGDILGTLRYMPPEAFEGRSDARGDVYSLGLTLYEMLAFRPAFEEKERNRLIKQVTQAEPARLGKLNRHVPQDLETIVHKAIDRDPSRRYASAGALAEDLQRFMEDEPIRARRMSQAERLGRWCRRNPVVAALTAAVALLLAGVALVSTVSAVRIAGARDAAILAQKKESEQRERAEDNAEVSRQRLVRAQVATGAGLMEQGDLHGALPWFAEALRLDQGDPAREENHRLRLAATLQRSPKLVAGWSTEAGPGRAVFCPDGRRVAVGGPRGLQVWDAAGGRLCLEVATDAAVTHFAFSPDGSRVATAGTGKSARVWNLETGRPLTPPLRHGGPVNRVAFRADGGRLVTASDDQTARVWDATTGEQLESLSPGEAVQSASFSPDGRRVVTLSGGVITVWEAAGGKRVTGFLADRGPFGQEAAFSPDGRRILMIGGQRIVRTWDADTGRMLSQIPQWGIAWLSPDRSRAVSGGWRVPCQVWDVTTGQPVTPPLGQARLAEAAFTLPGDRMALTGADGTVRVWDVETAEVVAGPLRHDSAITSATFSPDGRLLVTRDSAGLVRVWDLAGSIAPASPLKPALLGPCRWISRDGRWVVCGGGPGNLWLWDARTGRVVQTIHEDGGPWSATVSPDGRRLLTGAANGVARIWQATTGAPVGEPMRHGAWVSHVEFSPDGRLAATAGQDKTACVWDAATGRRIAEMKHEHGVRWAAFSPDGQRLVSATGDFSGSPLDFIAPQSDPRRPGEARVWDVATGRPVTAPIRHEGVVPRASFSPDGRFLLTTCVRRAADRGQVQVWDAATGRAVTPPLAHPQSVLHETFSPDGKLVATGCRDRAVRVWDAATGKALGVLAGHGGPVWHVSFSPDGRRLLTASEDGTARVWDATTGQPIARLKHGQAVWQAVFAADGHSVITLCVDASMRVWPLAPDHRPVDDWAALAELMVGGSRDASRGRGREEDWTATWQALRGKYPADFATTKTQQLAWHRAALEIATSKKAWSAALPHLTRLTEIDPENWQDRLARARLLARLERWHEAESEFTRAVQRHPGVLPVWLARGSFFLGRGQRDRAEADFARAIDLRATPELPAVLSEFWVAGLYPDDLKTSCPPESQPDPSRPVPAVTGPKAGLPVLPRWRGEVTDVSGYLDLAACFDGAEHISAYALAYVYSKTEQEVVLLTGSDDGMRLWLNGQPIYVFAGARPPAPDQDRVPAKLRRGWNIVLAKVVNDTGDHGLFLRLSADPQELARARDFVHPLALRLYGTARATRVREGTAHRVEVTAVDGTPWHVQLVQGFDDLQEGATYTVRFRARADAPREVNLYAQIAEPDWHGIGLNKAVPLTKDWGEYRYEFQAKGLAAQNLLVFNVGERTGTVWIADFTLTKRAK
jgi:WD40 repeat protein/serine/threonine protein kinase